MGRCAEYILCKMQAFFTSREIDTKYNEFIYFTLNIWKILIKSINESTVYSTV